MEGSGEAGVGNRFFASGLLVPRAQTLENGLVRMGWE